MIEITLKETLSGIEEIRKQTKKSMNHKTEAPSKTFWNIVKPF